MIAGVKYAIGACTLAMVVGLSFWAGMRFERADQIEVLQKYVDHANSNFEALRANIEASEQRAVQLNKSRAKALSRAEELKNELEKLYNRPSGDFTSDELRALTALHNRYFNASTDTSRVPNSVPTTTITE